MTHAGSGQQHSDAIAWQEWNDETLRVARALGRPILLDISAVWCHWCHVMDQTSYADPVVIDLIDRFYVPVRVDNDRRPDINERYNMGGWPTTAFLTPDGDMLTGATYIAPEQMRSTLERVADYYRRNKGAIARKAGQPQPPAPATVADAELAPGIVSNVLQAVLDNFDSAYGGFGDAPKFPHADALELALRDYQRGRSAASLTVVTKTLDTMAAGGIYDPLEGGFFRYSTTRDWRIPHFEKMLEGNAVLLSNYLRAYQVTGEARYAAQARDIMRYLNTVLSDQTVGGFYGSQDADEEYYGLPLAGRRSRPAPSIDHTLYVDRNAMMVSAYLQAAAVLDDAPAHEFALRTLDRLWQLCRLPEGGVCHYYDGEAHLPGLLTDQVYMGMALLDAYQASGAARYLAQAEELAGACSTRLADPAGGFRDSPDQPAAPGALKLSIVPLLLNAVASRWLLRLFWLTDKQHYRELAQRTLARFVPTYQRLSYFAAPFALAVDDLAHSPLKVVIVGNAADPRLHALQRAALALVEPHKVVQVLDPVRDEDAFQRSGFPLPEQPLAYPCVGATCLPPVSDAARLAGIDRDRLDSATR